MGLLDALIGLAILAFGMLSMTGFQARLVTQGTEAQSRIAASLLADELLTLAMLDPANAACYTVPATGVCGNATARANTDAWAVRALGGLTAPASVTTVLDGNGRLEAVLTWRGRDPSDNRELRALTDVRI